MKPITAFFGAPSKAAATATPAAAAAAGTAMKRSPGPSEPLAAAASGDEAASPAANKRARPDGDASAVSPSASAEATSGLTPEQVRRIEENRAKALEKRQQRAATEDGAETFATLEQRTMGPSWHRVLEGQFSQPYFQKLHAFLEAERAAGHKIFPPPDDIYSWSRMCSFEDVRVVILGQDPYINDGQAHGCAFSVRRGVPVPPSLANMYAELAKSVPGFEKPNHGYLAAWCKQANSHAGQGWETFTDAVVQALNQKRSNLVFLLWGAPAQKRGKGINANKHLVLKAAHPSPLSAFRGFMGCNHFVLANEYLVKNGLKPIDWNAVNTDTSA